MTKPSTSSVHPTRFPLSSPIIPRLREPPTRLPGPSPRSSASILSAQPRTIPLPRRTVLDPTVPKLSRSIPKLSGTVRECSTKFATKSKEVSEVSRDLYLEQTEVSGRDLEQCSNTDWNHNQVASSRPTKVKSGKVGPLWQCRKKGFERRWIRKRDAAIYGRSPASRRREEERYLEEEDVLSGTISPDSGSKYDTTNASFTYSLVWCLELSFIHLFRLFLLRHFKSTTTQRCSRHSTDTRLEFHAEAPQATANAELVTVHTWRPERDSYPRPFGR